MTRCVFKRVHFLEVDSSNFFFFFFNTIVFSNEIFLKELKAILCF